ncbi:MAG: hypothetical protein HY566_03540 [Candidatus Kerfeldbacteria bacterium]|nr:hypothetical protein [Candidatus Kerfeldbacteria bacterium]
MLYSWSMNDRDIQLSSWLVRVRPVLRRGAFLALLLLCVAVVLLAVWQSILYVASRGIQEELFADLARNRLFSPSQIKGLRPPILSVEDVTLLEDASGSVNAVAKVSNPSDQWALVTGAYAWKIDEETITTGRTTLRPSEQRYVVGLSLPASDVASTSRLTFEFTATTWKRILQPRDLPNVKFDVADTRYTILSNAPKNQVSTVSAQLANLSVESFPQVELTAILLNGQTIVGVGQLVLDDVKGLSTRQVELRFFQALSVTKALLQPGVDLFAAERI